ncbi:MAG: hypothetical protein K6F11_05930 [Lachnospiraceae bacterium]|nr:hypothetical protein [Lachnospiraceae bacterium]
MRTDKPKRSPLAVIGIVVSGIIITGCVLFAIWFLISISGMGRYKRAKTAQREEDIQQTKSDFRDMMSSRFGLERSSYSIEDIPNENHGNSIRIIFSVQGELFLAEVKDSQWKTDYYPVEEFEKAYAEAFYQDVLKKITSVLDKTEFMQACGYRIESMTFTGGDVSFVVKDGVFQTAKCANLHTWTPDELNSTVSRQYGGNETEWKSGMRVSCYIVLEKDLPDNGYLGKDNLLQLKNEMTYRFRYDGKRFTVSELNIEKGNMVFRCADSGKYEEQIKKADKKKDGAE